jgi:hypothetical protein
LGESVATAFKIAPQAHPVTASPSGMENVRLEEGRGLLRFSPRSKVFVAGAALLLIAVLSCGIRGKANAIPG